MKFLDDVIMPESPKYNWSR